MTPDPTPHAPSAPAAGQLELEEPMTDPTLRYVDMTGDILTIKPLQTSPSWGRETVVSVQIADGGEVYASPAIAYVRVGDVDQLIAALRKARDEAGAQATEDDDEDEACGEGMCQCSCGQGHPCGCDCPRCPDCQQSDDNCECDED